MEYYYLVRRAKWLEKRLAQTDETAPGRVFDVHEYEELRKAFPVLGVKYVPGGSDAEPPRIARRVVRPPEDEAPPVIEEVFVPGEGTRTQAHTRSPRARTVGGRDFPGRFIPGGL